MIDSIDDTLATISARSEKLNDYAACVLSALLGVIEGIYDEETAHTALKLAVDQTDRFLTDLWVEMTIAPDNTSVEDILTEMKKTA